MLEVVVQNSSCSTDRRRDAEGTVKRLRRIAECLDRFLCDVRRRERRLHRILIAEETDTALARNKNALLAALRTHALDIDGIEFVGVEGRCRPPVRIFCRVRDACPQCACRCKCDSESQFSLGHFHFPP